MPSNLLSKARKDDLFYFFRNSFPRISDPATVETGGFVRFKEWID